jgi:predicted MFS family arabinose efflux permease
VVDKIFSRNRTEFVGLIQSDGRVTGCGRSTFEITLHLCGIVGVTNAFGVYLFSVLIPEMRASLGLGLGFIGLATGLGQGGVIVSSIVCGFLAFRLGALRLVFLSVAICSFCLLVMAVAVRPMLIASLLLIQGGAAAAVWVSVVVVTREAVPEAHQGKALGIMASTGTALGVFATGLLAPPLTTTWGWRSVWLLAALLTLALTAVGYLRLRVLNRSSAARGGANSEKGSFRLPRSLKKNIAVLLLAIALLNGATFIPFQTYLTSLLQNQFGWGLSEAKTSWSLIGIGSIFGGPLFGYVSDRISARLTLAIAYALLTLSAVGALLGGETMVLYGAVLMFGLAYGAVFGQLAAYITKTQNAESAGFLSGATYVAFGLGSMASNYSLGRFAESTGDFVGAYLAIAVGVSILLVLALMLPPDTLSRVTNPRTARAQ